MAFYKTVPCLNIPCTRNMLRFLLHWFTFRTLIPMQEIQSYPLLLLHQGVTMEMANSHKPGIFRWTKSHICLQDSWRATGLLPIKTARCKHRTPCYALWFHSHGCATPPSNPFPHLLPSASTFLVKGKAERKLKSSNSCSGVFPRCSAMFSLLTVWEIIRQQRFCCLAGLSLKQHGT